VNNPDNPPRWAPDPLGRHQYRYWDGARWTDHIADDGMVGVDPPLAGPGASPGWSASATAVPANMPAAPRPGTGASQRVAVAPPVHDPTAVLGRRYGAFVIDAAVSLVVFGLIFFATATTHTRAEALRIPGCHLSANDSSQVECDNRAVVTVDDTVYETNIGAFAALAAAFTFLYFALAEGVWGRTLGKQLTGLRVVDQEGARVGFAGAVLRWLVFAVDGPLSLFLCGIITSAVSTGHRRLGDMAGSSFVVGRADAGRPVPVRPR
jgi:uncharacterized RDD family membrane protein YckC